MLSCTVVIAEIDIDAWRKANVEGTSYTPLPRFPAVYRDFAVVVDESIRAIDIQTAIRDVSPTLIRDVRFESLFRGGDLPKGSKSMAWSVVFRDDDATMEDAQVRELEAAIWSQLSSQVSGHDT